MSSSAVSAAASQPTRRKASSSTKDSKAEDDAKPLGRHNNRGHGRLWRATPTAREVVSPFLHMMRYTQGFTTLVTAVGVLWHTRAEAAFYLFGALSTSVAAKTLKSWIRDPRPDGTAVTRTYGLPSTHSATVTYMCAYLLFYTGRKVIEQGFSPLTHWEIAYSTFLLAYPPVVMWSRTALIAHTVKQVLAGAALGLVVANGAWQVWNLDNMILGGALKDQDHIRRWDGYIISAKAVVVRLLTGR